MRRRPLIQPRQKVKFFCFFLACIFMVLTIVGTGHLRSILGSLAVTRVSNLVNRIVSEAVSDAVESGEIQYNDLISLEKNNNGGVAALAHYIGRSGCHPVYDKTAVTYFPLGEDKFDAMLRELEAAKHFIFMEYFIVGEGLMWGRVLEILARKAAQGVDVRVMYDGTCEFALLPHDYPKRLRRLGIQCRTFAPVSPFVSTHYNYRDHRKILVIDGHTAFNGGVNLSDEYINLTHPHGHWKDTALRITGEAVRSFTLMFLQMWNVEDRGMEDCTRYLTASAPVSSPGWIIPYGDSPFDGENVAEMVYMDILNRARQYVHIMTPYLIIDHEMVVALTFAAKRGVDVKLITPGWPDKKTVFALTRSYYRELIAGGVEIYEYEPGFVHAKSFVSDGVTAVTGSINLDYRSLYLHFECAALLHSVPAVGDIEADFQAMLPKCRQVTPETVLKEKWTVKLAGVLLKVAAPLL